MSPLRGSNEFRALCYALIDLKDNCSPALAPGEWVQNGFPQAIVSCVDISKFFPRNFASIIFKINISAGVGQ
jgi:hypothetical protein